MKVSGQCMSDCSWPSRQDFRLNGQPSSVLHFTMSMFAIGRPLDGTHCMNEVVAECLLGNWRKRWWSFLWTSRIEGFSGFMDVNKLFALNLGCSSYQMRFESFSHWILFAALIAALLSFLFFRGCIIFILTCASFWLFLLWFVTRPDDYSLHPSHGRGWHSRWPHCHHFPGAPALCWVFDVPQVTVWTRLCPDAGQEDASGMQALVLSFLV